jgi:hypothetical protein
MHRLRSALAVVAAACGVVASVATSQLEAGVGDSTSADPFALEPGARVEYDVAVDGKTTAPLATGEDARTLRVTVHLHGEDPADDAPDGQVVHATLSAAGADGPLVEEDVAAADGEVDFVVPFAEECAGDACTHDEAWILVVERTDESEGIAHGRVTATVHAVYDVDEPPADDAIDLSLSER